MKTRTFLAIEINTELKEKINKTIKDFQKTESQIKYVETENLHLTLKFFGDLDEIEIEDVKEATERTIKKFKPFTLQIEKMGAFPNTNHMKVIWVGVKENNDLELLQKQLDKEFKILGFKKEKNYKSHLTIGRMKGSKNKDKIRKTLKEKENITVGKLEVKTLHLKKSTLTPKGPIYEDIEVFKL